MPIAGFTRFRAHQLGKETVFGTAVTATRRMPYRGSPAINPNWTQPDVDTGTLDPVLKPFRTQIDITSPMAGPLAFNDAPYLWSAALLGGVTPTGGGAAKTWDFTAASETADPFEYFTDEWGDDFNASDGFQMVDGVIETLHLSMPEDLGPWQVDATWRFAKLGTFPTARAALSVDASPTWVYGADTSVYLNSTSGTIGTTKLTDTVHAAEVTINNNLDLKSFANGSNSRFQLAGYGRGGATGREIIARVTFAKTATEAAEIANLLAADAVDRFIEINTTAAVFAQAGIPYAHRMRFPARWFTMDQGEIGGNTTVILEGHGFYDASGLTYPFNANVVTTLTAL